MRPINFSPTGVSKGSMEAMALSPGLDLVCFFNDQYLGFLLIKTNNHPDGAITEFDQLAVDTILKPTDKNDATAHGFDCTDFCVL